MDSHHLAQTTPGADLPGKSYFTVDQANAALPYVARVAGDIVKTYGEIRQLQRQIGAAANDDNLRDLEKQHERKVARLNEVLEELGEVGVELKDIESGLIDFPAMHEGREICLCWRLDEPHIIAWHETDAGFAGRQAIELLQM